MAEYTFGTSNSAITGKIIAEYSQNITANTSTLTCTLSYKRNNDGYTTHGTFSGGITAGGTRKTLSKSVSLSGGQWVAIGSHTWTFTHDANGAKSVTISADGGIAGTSFSSTNSNSNTMTFKTIQRKPKITSMTAGTKTNTSFSWSWKSDVTTNKISYRILQGSTVVKGWTTTSKSATSGTETVSGLSQNTSYKLEMQVSRNLSGDVWSNSSYLSFTTLSCPTLTSSPNFKIGDSSMKVTFTNPGNNTFTLKLLSGNTTIGSVSVSGTSYTWNFTSNQNTAMYKLCPNGTSLSVSLQASITLNSQTYTSTKTGTATVQSSLCTPSTPTYSIACTESNINTILGTATTLLQGVGSIKATISTTSTAKNSASISKYTASIIKDGNVYQYAETTGTTLTFDPIQTAGTFQVQIKSVDSRGYSSSIVSKSFDVLAYKAPSLNVKMQRVNNYEKEIILSITAYVSRIIINGTDKNKPNQFLGFMRNGGNFNSLASIYTVETTDEYYKIIVDKPASSPFMTIATNESANFTFYAFDNFLNTSSTATQSSVHISPGTPAMSVLENGKVAINTLPDANGSALQVTGGAQVKGGLTVDNIDIGMNLTLLNKGVVPYMGQCTDPNNATETGIYSLFEPTANSPGFSYGTMLVLKVSVNGSSSNYYIQQTVYSVVDSNVAFRTRNESSWRPWSRPGYVNTAETTSGELFYGSRVYTKLVFVTLPNTATTTSVAHKCTFGKYYWIDMANSFIHMTSGTGMSYPLNNGFYNMSARLDKTNVAIKTNETGWSGWEAVVCLKYTK